MTIHSLSVPEEEKLDELLARYLFDSPHFRCPGFDGATLHDLVATEYLTACASGLVPQPVELLKLHPELAEPFRRYFSEWTAQQDR